MISTPSQPSHDNKKLSFTESSGVHYNIIVIVNDASGVVRMTIVSDATTWNVTYN
jgi:hypothetical protein